MVSVRTGQYIFIFVATLLSIACSPRPRPHVPVAPGAVVSGRDSVTQSPQGPCVVQLVEPASKAVLKQIRRSNDKVEIVWEFIWRDCPEARRYHLHVMGPQATNPLIDDDSLATATYLYRSQSYGIPHRKGWAWMVRAYVDGRWGNWSEKRTFDVAPPSEPRRVRHKGDAGSPEPRTLPQ
jgi:hypothetical protein